MDSINIRKLMDSSEKYMKVWESKDLNHRILYFQLDKADEGIPAHFHPHGEDHAIVLEGELTYDISFNQQIKASENEIVFGWNKHVHGYHNHSDKPLHLLVFATPEYNPSVYSEVGYEVNKGEKMRKATINKDFGTIASDRMKFSIETDEVTMDMFAYDKDTKELWTIKPDYEPIQPLLISIQFL